MDFFEDDFTAPAPAAAQPVIASFEAPAPTNTAAAKSPYADLPPLRRFQLERQEQLAEKDQRSEQERRARLDKAQEAIKGMYEERSSRKTQQAKLNREQEADFVASQHELESLGNVWERVVRLVDLEQKPNRKDVARFRQVLIQCKNNPVA